MIRWGGVFLCTILLSVPAPAEGDEAEETSSPGELRVPSTPGVERARDTVLVMDLRADGVAEDLALQITSRVADLLAAHSTLKVVTAEEAAAMLKHQQALLRMDCQDDTCIAEITRVANARFALSGSLGKIGSGYILTLSFVDAVEARTAGSVAVPAANIEALAAELPGAVSSLVGTGTGEQPRYRLPEGREVSFAVFDLEPLGLSAEVSRNLTQVLAAEIKEIEGAGVVSRDDIAAMFELEAQKIAMDCANEACLAEIGGALGVEKLIVGHVGMLSERYVVSLRLIDVQSSVVESRVSETFKGVEDQLMAAVRAAGRGLLGIESSEPGILAITATTNEAQLFLDDDYEGDLPMRPLTDLTPGRYVLHVTKRGFLEWRSEVYVEPGETNMVWVEMTEKPPKIAFWTFLSATAATSAATILVAGIAQSHIDDFNYEMARPEHGDPIRRTASQTDAAAFSLAANVLLVSTGVLAAGTGIAAIFTDWE